MSRKERSNEKEEGKNVGTVPKRNEKGKNQRKEQETDQENEESGKIIIGEKDEDDEKHEQEIKEK